MVDNRSAGALGVAGGFNFKSGDTSGSANKMSDDKMGQGAEYVQFETYQEEQQQQEVFVDRSAQLSATLNSLAMVNVAGILKNIKKSKTQETAKNSDFFIEEELNDSETNDEEKEEQDKKQKRNKNMNSPIAPEKIEFE